MKVKIKKLEELPDATHPNNIDVDYEKEGEFRGHPVVGDCFYVGHNFRTSRVTEVIDNTTFKTMNSIYQYLISNE